MNNTERNRADKPTTFKIVVVFCAFLLAVIVIVARLVKYQLVNYEYYQSQVIKQLTTETVINAERGDITDVNGVVLATNKTVYNIIISPKHIVQMNEKIKEVNSDSNSENDIKYDWRSEDGKASYVGTEADKFIANYLSYTLDVDYNTIIEKMAKTSRQYEVISKNVEASVTVGIREFIAENNLSDQVYDQATFKRYYPYGSLASHAIGFTGSEGQGRDGLEIYYDEYLAGEDGRFVTAQDANSNDMPFEFESYVDAKNGYTLVSTIDKYIQSALENQLEMTYNESQAGNRVCGIAMDVETGGILAMGTYPNFDLNAPGVLDAASQAKLDLLEKGTEEYDKLSGELLFTMWKNKAITELYEPGSTYKIITVSSALEERVVNLNTPVRCPGYEMVEGWPYPINCHELLGHSVNGASFPLWHGLQQSCNPAMMQVAKIMGKETFYKYFEAFGYTSRTGIDLPSETSGIFTPQGEFTNVNMAVYSFGQTFKTTPIQQITAISAVASGGYLKTPHLMSEILDENGKVIEKFETEIKRQVVSTAVCEEIIAVLEDGVSGNGGAKNAYVKGYKVAAKTGTSEKRDKFDENGEKSFRVGSCVAFAPADDPKIAVIIMVDEPMAGAVYGSVVAAPYVSNFLAEVLPYMGIEQKYTEADLATLDVSIPSYVGGTPDVAIEDLALNGLSYEVIGEGSVITSQYPQAGSTMRKENGKVLLYCGETAERETVTVPDLINKTADAANMLLLNAGLNVKISGATNGSTATIIKQFPTAGSVVEVGTIVEFELRHMDVTD